MTVRSRTSNGSPAHIGSLAVTVAVALVVLLSLAVSCGGESNNESYSLSDSAGITIVENSAARLARVPTWPVATEPTLSIESEDEADLVLFDVSSVAVLHGGTVAVTNSSRSEVLLFSQRGSLLRTIGGSGEGPGEFRNVTSVVPLPGDSIGVFDSSYQRLSVFDDRGRLGREVSFRDLAQERGLTLVQTLGPGGLALLTQGGFQSDPPEGIYRTYREWHRVDLDGHPRSSYGEFPGNELFQNGQSMGSPLFSFITSATTHIDTLIVGTGESPQVWLFGPEGGPSRIIRWVHDPEPVTEDTLSVFLEKGLATVPEAGRDQVRAMFESIPGKDLIPPYSTVLCSPQGLIWVGSYDGLGAVTPLDRPPGRSWLIFDPQGVLIARAKTPEGFRVHTVQDETLLGVFRDEMMVESIRAYSFQGN